MALNEKPFLFTNDHPDFQMRGWRELLGSAERIPAVEMVRHTLITGETGSGKSASGVIPLLEGGLRYPDEERYEAYRKKAGKSAESRGQLRPTVLVVDPKQELWEVVMRHAGDRNMTISTTRFLQTLRVDDYYIDHCCSVAIERIRSLSASVSSVLSV